jgi:hypothetical protein
MSTKQELFAAIAAMPTVKPVTFSGGLGTLYMRHITEAQAEALYAESAADNRRAMFVVFALANADGSRLLSDDDLQTVKTWPLSILMRLWIEGGKFNGLIPDTSDEDLSKNPERMGDGSSR